MVFLSDFKLSDYHWIKPRKDGVKVVVGFDIYHKTVRIWRTKKLNFSDSELQEFPFREEFLSEGFFAELQEILKLYAAGLSSEKQVYCHLVVPDCMTTMDAVTIPQMGAKKREVALEGVLNNLLADIKQYELKRYLYSTKSKIFVYTYAFVAQKGFSELNKALGENKLSAKFTTFESCSRLNGVLHLRPAFKKKDFLFMDIQEDSTDVIVCLRGRVFAFTRLQLGRKHLSRTEMLQENMLYNHDVANLAILNAQEKAKSKKLTVSEKGSEESLEAVADDVIQQLQQGVNLNAEEISKEEKKEEQARGLEFAVKSLAEPAAEDEEEEVEEESESEEEETEEAHGPRQKVFKRMTPKRLPKFMLRPEPTDEQGYVYENFRMFIKWAILYQKWLKDSEYVEALDCCLVNLPKEYEFLMDRANNGEDKSEISFELLGEVGEKDVSDCLDMVGVLYAGMYNKRFNF